MNVRPLHDRIWVVRMEESEQMIGGIIIPDSAKEKAQAGKVAATGPGRTEKDGKVTPLTVKVGDTVLWAKYGGQEFKFEGQEYVILREDEIFGVVEGKK